jgi:hypothetical protein
VLRSTSLAAVGLLGDRGEREAAAARLHERELDAEPPEEIEVARQPLLYHTRIDAARGRRVDDADDLRQEPRAIDRGDAQRRRDAARAAGNDEILRADRASWQEERQHNERRPQARRAPESGEVHDKRGDSTRGRPRGSRLSRPPDGRIALNASDGPAARFPLWV